ncbi:MAG: radical SAM protein [Candidatus Aenigmatarchaeota archaeon]
MRVLFLIPPADGRAPDRNFGCNYGIEFQEPSHILYPAAMLEKYGHEAEFVDCPVEKKDSNWVEEYVKKFDAIVFFTVFLSEEIDKKWAKKIRKINKNAYIIFLGPEPTRKPHDFIFDDRVFVVRGEPELTIVDLFKYLEKTLSLNNVLGLSFGKLLRNKLRIIDNPPRGIIENLDEIPFPARHLIKNPMLYFNPKLKGRPVATMLTSRQCWAQCIYCIPSAYTFSREIEGRRATGKIKNGKILNFSKTKKPPVRFRSAENVFKEFKMLKELGYKAVAIMDDDFLALTKLPEYKKRILKICELIRPLKMEWGCLARADECQDKEILEAMKEAGCKYIDLGIESFEQDDLNFVRKGMSVGDQMNAILLIKRIGIEPKINVLIGVSPFQTKENIKWTVEILKMLNIKYASFSIVTPHPATQYYEVVKKNKWFATKSGDWIGTDPYREGIVDLPNLTQKDMKELVRWCYTSFYLRPSYILKRLFEVKSIGELIELFKVMWNLVFRKT